VEPAALEISEPESTLALYASTFQLRTEDVQLAARPASLEGLTCVVAEHIPIQVRRQRFLVNVTTIHRVHW
jgi:hypothetical protein